MDSVYAGYRFDYRIACRNPTVRFKNVAPPVCTRPLIDGQQSVAALMTFLLGEMSISRRYQRIQIQSALLPEKRNI